MFLQCPRGEVILLPALPTQLPNGLVSGLCAEGGFEVDNLTWTNGQLSVSHHPFQTRQRLPSPFEMADYVSAGTVLRDAPMVFRGCISSQPPPAAITRSWPPTPESENLSATTSAGDTQQIITNAAFSNLRGTRLNANAPGDFVNYTLTNSTPGIIMFASRPMPARTGRGSNCPAARSAAR